VLLNEKPVTAHHFFLYFIDLTENNLYNFLNIKMWGVFTDYVSRRGNEPITKGGILHELLGKDQEGR
jgi:hypothetical protein